MIREREKLGVRRPLAKATITSPDPTVRAAIQQFSSAIGAELNVKAIEILEDDAQLCKLSVKPNFRTLGKRLGPKLKAVQAALQKLEASAISALASGGTLELEGEALTQEDVLVTREAAVEGAVESHAGLTVLLDTTITKELHAEGLARELVNRVQALRKQAGLDVSQRIRLVLVCEGTLGEVVDSPALRELIARETLATQLEHARDAAAVSQLAHVKEDQIERERISIGLEAV